MVTLAKIIGDYGLGTDKNSAHCYCDRFYDTEFLPWRERPVSLLEIGVHGGESIFLWDKYFVNAQRIVGIDVTLENARRSARPFRPCVEFVEGDAYDFHQSEKLGDFDIIIDDGRHALNWQQRGLQLYLKHLNPGGIYIVEDVQHAIFFDNLDKSVPDNLKSGIEHIELSHVNGRVDDRLFIVRRP